MSASDSSSAEKVLCDHCLQQTTLQSAITALIDGRKRYFCCKGCLGVYELVNSNSLDAFYRQRCDWQPGPPETGVKLQTAHFTDTVTIEGDEYRIELLLSGIRCASCVWLIEKFLAKVDGVLSARVNYATHKAVIVWSGRKTSLDTILNAIRDIGYLPHPAHINAGSTVFAEEKQDLLLRFGTAGFFSMQLMLFSAALYAGFFQGMESRYRVAFQLVSWALATPVLFYSGFPFLSSAWRSLKRMTLNMDVLVALGALSAYLYSIAMIPLGGEVFFDSAAMIITFILLGRFLEAGSRLKAGNAMARLAELQPQEALLVTEFGQTTLVPLTAINPGDRIEVIPGDRIPLDGMVIEGEAEVNESMLTGESRPVLKEPGCEIFAGSFSMNGRLLFRVTGDASTTLLCRIIKTVEDAQARKAPIQNIADKTAGFFVPVTILLALSTFLYWKLSSGSTVTALLNAVSVLVIACPCALGLATPLAILVATTAAGRKGILIKGGDIFETLSGTTTVVLDKTGTITRGKPSITDLHDFARSPAFLQHAASLEAASEHPTAQAIVGAWKGGELLKVDHFRAIPGRGVSGMIAGESWLAGSEPFMKQEAVAITPEEHSVAAQLETEGKTVVLVACNGGLAGVIGLIDDLRDDALPLIEGLRKKGLSIQILTGDNRGVADYIAARCGITDVQAALGPLEKAAVIRELKAKGECVMMVGDGINDAPALTEADTGVTVGQASGIAIESAGVAILKDDLRLINTLLDSSSKCFSVIRQNLFWAFAYNLTALPLAVTGVLHPIISALLMATSSLVVVSNSLRLKKT
ncbi:heavy metal translocating P-type ATPase [Chlorobium ferrooxidans]|uniref:P-type Cu(2+) transporter n=1 Tax=Chlorobium ferrooxidans DSM 13031 TaxID=377431 RepID=Q0YUT2_9CHLB|nr:heavy metal translocating P-type ATPase [Chlorobium ferrooxidans]EAT59954.1 ATPase, E1-E2 type:Copper-translocating P-type ATPase:Heavy metal translocating P-type ATPase [Chlorobium ferrooxidans DSM 13031]